MVKMGDKALVIGVGNEYRGDDGVGIYIARRLKVKKLPGTIVKIESGEGISLMESWDGASMVSVIDAMNSGDSCGKIYRFDAHKQSITKQFYPNSTHHFGVAEAVELAKALNRLPEYFMIYGIEGESFKEEIGLSPEVERAANVVINMVMEDTREAFQI
jgi:hydrogenase maturation protease